MYLEPNLKVFSSIVVFFYLTSTQAKNVRIQLDSEDLLNIIKTLISKDVPVQRSNYGFRNPYHPEDGMIDDNKAANNFKTHDTSKVLFQDYKSERTIESENNVFLKDPNKISDDELE
ncbi:unnamed protein product [Leptosia nina]|uniref:Uncharacterized protein n=1 Tax=Leptosia nina TaxID=320188 RepID=A0AAV1J6D2_9NEOP